ncbi:MAG: hypothetical protein ACRDRW_00580 [Pseudonocardiaceae bacterium]
MADGATASESRDQPHGDPACSSFRADLDNLPHASRRGGPVAGHPAWCCPRHCFVTDDGVRVHQSAPTRDEDAGAWVETRLVCPEDGSDTYLQLLVADMRFGREVTPFVQLATATRLRDRLSAYLNAAEHSEPAPEVG